MEHVCTTGVCVWCHTKAGYGPFVCVRRTTALFPPLLPSWLFSHRVLGGPRLLEHLRFTLLHSVGWFAYTSV